MSFEQVGIVSAHLALAMMLFLGVNWIGKHAVDFGYASTVLFEEPNESVALNFFIRAMSPAIFIIALSAGLVYFIHAEWRLDIHFVSVYYYALRAVVIVLLNRQRLISWPRFLMHAAAGITAASIAYHKLILPNRSLLPNLESAGNELWLAIMAFLYTVANKVELSSGPSARRRNEFVQRHYRNAVLRFGELIDSKISESNLKLLTYAVLIFEGYARPPAIREIERAMFWKRRRTTGIMQVAANHALSDSESVESGTDLLLTAWRSLPVDATLYDRTTTAIAAYNADDDYVSRVLEVVEIIAKRVDPGFRPAYDKIWE